MTQTISRHWFAFTLSVVSLSLLWPDPSAGQLRERLRRLTESLAQEATEATEEIVDDVLGDEGDASPDVGVDDATAGAESSDSAPAPQQSSIITTSLGEEYDCAYVTRPTQQMQQAGLVAQSGFMQCRAAGAGVTLSPFGSVVETGATYVASAEICGDPSGEEVRSYVLSLIAPLLPANREEHTQVYEEGYETGKSQAQLRDRNSCANWLPQIRASYDQLLGSCTACPPSGQAVGAVVQSVSAGQQAVPAVEANTESAPLEQQSAQAQTSSSTIITNSAGQQYDCAHTVPANNPQDSGNSADCSNAGISRGTTPFLNIIELGATYAAFADFCRDPAGPGVRTYVLSQISSLPPGNVSELTQMFDRWRGTRAGAKLDCSNAVSNMKSAFDQAVAECTACDAEAQQAGQL